MKCCVIVLFIALFLGANALAESAFTPILCHLADQSPNQISIQLAKNEPTKRSIFSKPYSRPTLIRPKPVIPLSCNRPFLYHGEFYSIDSPQAQDAQTLKYFTRASERAQTLLTEYQENRDRSRISAYTGTLGGMLILFAGAIGRWIHPRDPKTIRSASTLLGAAIAIEGFSYSFMLLRKNESNITQAVDAYNLDQPKDSIDLELNAKWSF